MTLTNSQFSTEGKFIIDDRLYRTRIYHKQECNVDATRIIIVAFQPNAIAKEILRICIKVVKKVTLEPYELWIIDNNSPVKYSKWLTDLNDVNVVINQTDPLPVEARGRLQKLFQKNKQYRWGSYANAIGLEIGVRVIDSKTRYLMTMHMDSMPCRIGWLSFLRSKMDDGNSAVGVRMDKVRTEEGILHVLGCMFDFQVFKALQLNFFPDLPKYDVGDLVSVKLRSEGYKLFACRNTLWQPQLIEEIPSESPLRDLPVDRSFDDDSNVIFLHLGRGVKKTRHERRTDSKAVEEWIGYAEKYILET